MALGQRRLKVVHSVVLIIISFFSIFYFAFAGER